MRSLFFPVGLLSFCLHTVPLHASDLVNVAGLAHYPPSGAGRAAVGENVPELVKNAFEGMGKTAKIEFLPRNRALLDTKNGKYEASFPWIKNESREKDFLFSDPIFTGEAVVAVHVSSPLKIFTAKDAWMKHSCDLLGSQFQARFFADQKVNVTAVSDLSQCLEMLKRKRIDFYFEVPTVPEEQLDPAVKIIPHELNLTMTWHLIVPRTLPGGRQIIENFNRELSRLKREAR